MLHWSGQAKGHLKSQREAFGITIHSQMVNWHHEWNKSELCGCRWGAVEEGLGSGKERRARTGGVLSSERRAELGRGQVRSVSPKQLWISDSQSTKCPVHRFWQIEMEVDRTGHSCKGCAA